MLEMVAEADLQIAIRDLLSSLTKKPERKQIYQNYLTVLRYGKDLTKIKAALERVKKPEPELQVDAVRVKHLQQVIGNFKNIMRGLDNLKLYHVWLVENADGGGSGVATISNNQGKNIKTNNELLDITHSENSFSFKPKEKMDERKFVDAVLAHIKNSGLLIEESW
jgi:hypothetical protein